MVRPQKRAGLLTTRHQVLFRVGDVAGSGKVNTPTPFLAAFPVFHAAQRQSTCRFLRGGGRATSVSLTSIIIEQTAHEFINRDYDKNTDRKQTLTPFRFWVNRLCSY